MARAICFSKTGGPEVLRLRLLRLASPAQERLGSGTAMSPSTSSTSTSALGPLLAAAERARFGRGRRCRGCRPRGDRGPRRRPRWLSPRPAGRLFGRARDAGGRADPAARRDLRPQRINADDEGHDGAIPFPPGPSAAQQGASSTPPRAVGLIACQWARALGGTMISRISTKKKAQIARANGCAHTIVTSREGIATRVREITEGKGVPVVYHSVGKDTLQASLDSLQPRGVLVSNGTSSGPVVIDAMQLAVKGSLWLTRPAMAHYATPRSHMLEMAEELFDLVLAGKISSEPSTTLPLEKDRSPSSARRTTTGATVRSCPDPASRSSERPMHPQTAIPSGGRSNSYLYGRSTGLVRVFDDGRLDALRLHRPADCRLDVTGF